MKNMKGMKWVYLLAGLFVGLGGGLILGLRSAERKVIEAYPEEIRPAVEAAVGVLGEMDEEETKELLQDIRERGKQVIHEHHMQTLWEGLYASTVLHELEEGDIEGAKKFSQGRVDFFRATYEEGMEIGDWQELADKLYQRTGEKVSEETDE